MRRGLTVAAAVAAAALFTTTIDAQKTTEVHPGTAGSPHVRIEAMVDGATISVEYGRPSLKGRAEAQMMPPGKEWRTGADEATTLKTDKALMFGTLHVNPGTYTLYTVPGEKEWQLVISKKTGQWGVPYPTGEDVGRVPMTVAKGTATEQLTISIDDAPKGGTLSVQWGTTKATATFSVM